VLFKARPDLSEVQQNYVRTRCKSLDEAAGYIDTIPVPAPRVPAPARPAAPLADIPRGGEGNESKLLSKTSDRLVVARAMGQATAAKAGPTLVELPGGGGTFFSLGSLTPKEYRARRAKGWDPTKEFPLASEAMQ
jgi:hypothetical protein